MRGVFVVLLALVLTACATNPSALQPALATDTACAPGAASGPVPAQDLARRLGMSYTDSSSHVLLASGASRVRIWKNSNEVSVSGETVRLQERSQPRGACLMVPASTARYVESRVGSARRCAAAPVRRRAVQPVQPLVCATPRPARPSRRAAAPIRAPQPVIATAPKVPAADPAWHAPGVSHRKWRWIVVHHSDDTRGDLARYDRIHRENNGWDECGYHFVIGNGSLSGDGEVEVGSRWFKQKHGAHAKTPDNRFNDFGVGICLVGDFEDGSGPTPAQMEALTHLCSFLMARYDVPLADVIGHCDCKATACPGRKFPWADLRRRLGRPAF